MKQYMVVERFAPGRKAEVYERFHQKGRMLPDGLTYLDSWLEKDGDRCFQLMETDNPALFEVWKRRWNDLVSIEVIELGAKPSKDA
ncbi:MAG: DUF3303 family protein [Opitutaceae bacterium]